MKPETDTAASCGCLPGGSPGAGVAGINPTARRCSPYPDLVPVPGGETFRGTDHPFYPGDGEGPARRVELPAYSIGATTVTNAQFAEFVADTAYVTDAEQRGHSLVFHSQCDEGVNEHGAVVILRARPMKFGWNWMALRNH